MGLDMWFRDDVVRLLAALASAGEAHGPEYQRALRDVGIAFGLVKPNTEPGETRRPVLVEHKGNDWR